MNPSKPYFSVAVFVNLGLILRPSFQSDCLSHGPQGVSAQSPGNSGSRGPTGLDIRPASLSQGHLSHLPKNFWKVLARRTYRMSISRRPSPDQSHCTQSWSHAFPLTLFSQVLPSVHWRQGASSISSWWSFLF